MSNTSLIPIATYVLKVLPGVPVSISDDDYPVTVRITMAAIDPESVDGEKTPSTLRILKRPDPFALGGFMDSDEDDEDDSDEDDEEDDKSSEEEEEAPKKVLKGKKANGSKTSDKDVDMDEDDEDEDEEEEEDDDDDDDLLEVDPVTVCTLSPSTVSV